MSDNRVRLFSDLVSRADSEICMPAAALAIARVGYPDLEIDSCLDKLDEMGRRAAVSLRGVALEEEVGALGEIVFGELGFSGDRENYYDPRNSFLNDVLDRRRGIPITISLVYIEIAALCGIGVSGVGFPGHFLVRHDVDGALLDPFNKGARVDDDACRKLLDQQGLCEVEDLTPYLQVVSRRQMLERMLNNLGRYYAEVRDSEKLALVSEFAEALRPGSDQESPGLVH